MSFVGTICVTAPSEDRIDVVRGGRLPGSWKVAMADS